MSLLVKVSWIHQNIFTSYDIPAYILLDTEGKTVRLKVYETYDNITSVYIDDTATNTNRSGTIILKVWDTNQHGNPPSTPAFYDLIVEIYDTNNMLIETKTLKYEYVASNTTIHLVKADTKTELVALINYVDSQGYFIQYYGSNISFYYDPNGYIEVVQNSGKYYGISKVSKIASQPGSYTLYVNPADSDGYVRVEFDIVVTNDLLNAIYNAPLISNIMSFLMWLGANWINYNMVIASHILSYLGFSNFFIEKVEYFTTTDGKPALRIIARQDISPLLVFVAGVAVGAVVTFIISNVIRDITRSWAQIETTKSLTDLYQQYVSLYGTIVDYCKTQKDPEKCINDITSTITPPSTMATSVGQAVSQITNENNQLKTVLNIMIVGLVIVALFVLWQSGTLTKIAGAVSK